MVRRGADADNSSTWQDDRFSCLPARRLCACRCARPRLIHVHHLPAPTLSLQDDLELHLRPEVDHVRGAADRPPSCRRCAKPFPSGPSAVNSRSREALFDLVELERLMIRSTFFISRIVSPGLFPMVSNQEKTGDSVITPGASRGTRAIADVRVSRGLCLVVMVNCERVRPTHRSSRAAVSSSCRRRTRLTATNLLRRHRASARFHGGFFLRAEAARAASRASRAG